MDIKVIIFDIGGVILTHAKTITPELIAKTYNIPLKVATREYQTVRESWRTGKITYQQFFQQLKDLYGVKESLDEIEAAYLRAYKEIAGIDKEMIALVAQLRKLYKVVALTNTVDIHARYNEERGLFRYFDQVYISHKIGVIKPDPWAFQFVTDDLHVQPSECLFIDDKEENIAAARTFGMQTYHFIYTKTFETFLQKEHIV